jgi:poly(hydroxyalkanoate) depolymerase family esterase
MIDMKTAAGMREATRLTQAKQLHEAVAVIQRTLQGEMGLKPEASAHRPATKTTTEVRRHPADENKGAREQHPQRSLFTIASVPREAGPEPAAARQQVTAKGLIAGLRESLHRFRGPRPLSEPIPDQTPDIVPDGGRFTTGSFSNQAGMRSYKLYIPSGYHGQPLPLVVMLHGCTQNPDDFAAGTRMNVLAEEHQFFVAYPEQSRAANGSKCWNWFEAAHQQRDGGEPSIIAGLTRQILGSYRIDPERVYIAGLSAGGAMALTLAMTHPDLYAAVGIHSGLPHAVAKDLPSALAAMKSGQVNLVGRHSVGASGMRRHTVPIPAIVFHGDRDTTVHPCNGDQVIAQCVPAPPRRETPPEGGLARQMSVMQGKVPHGHAYTRTTYHNANGQPFVEHWLVHGAGHAWSGGSASGSYTDPKGPDASREMFHFFYHHRQSVAAT